MPQWDRHRDKEAPIIRADENQSVSWARRSSRIFKMRLVLFKCHISYRERAQPRGQSQRGVTRQGGFAKVQAKRPELELEIMVVLQTEI